MTPRILLLAIALLTTALTARADLFTLTVETEGRTGTAGTSAVLDFARFFNDAGLRRVVDAYTPTSAATANVNFRGIPARLSYPANSTALTLQIPSLGITETFQGSTRDESQRLLEDWFRGRGASRVRDVLREAVARTSVDPVAGNPNSLMSQMFANDFTSALSEPGQGSTFGFGFRIGSFSAEDFNTRSYTLPLSYSFTTAGGDRVLLDLPLTVVDTEGAYSYSGSFGAGYRFALTRDRSWTLQPTLRIGSVGSLDVGALATIVSGSLTSVYTQRFDGGYTVTLGNMIGHARTLPINYGGFDLDYRLQNTVLRNGIVGTMPLGDVVAGVPMNLGAFITDTRFFGDRQRVQNYQEIGLILSARELFGRALTSPVEFGFTYLNGANGYRGFTFNTGVRF